jgi:aminoglycoside phosphotransferase (APT) family kinase protein
MGRPAMIMTREPGSAEYLILNGDRPLAERRRLAVGFCELLARVHAVPWQAAGLADVLEAPAAPAQHELTAWLQVLHNDQLEPYPELELAASWLRAHAPTARTLALVHADFKPGNILVEGGRIVALPDWELAHLGDPIEDLGWVTQPLRRREHLITGTWEADDLVTHYERCTGVPVDSRALYWWQTMSTFKTAVMQVSGLRAFIERRATKCTDRQDG